jgi:DNA polymerase-3 subunit gamma/tau
VFRAVNRVMEGGHDPRRFAADLLDRFRDLIVLAAVPGAGQTGLLDMPADRLDRMTEQASRFGQAELTRAAEIISEGLIQMRGATSPRLLLELACAQILLPAASAGDKALLVRLERLERRLEGGQAAPSGAVAGGGPVPAAPGSAGPMPAASAPLGPAASVSPAPAAAAPSAARSRPAASPATAAPSDTVASPGTVASSGTAASPTPAVSSGPSAPPAGAASSARPAAPTPGDAPAPSRPGRPPSSRAEASAAPGTASPGSAASAPAPSPNAAPASSSAATPPAASSPAAAAPAAPGGHPAPGASSEVDALRQRWPEILEAVKGKRRVAWMLLSNATVHSVEDGVLTMLFPREGDAKGFATSGADRDLTSVLTSVTGLTLRIKAMSAAQLASTPGAARSPHGGPDDLSAKAPAAVQMPSAPPEDPGPPHSLPHTLSAEAQYDSAPAQPVAADLTGMDLIKRELGGRVIAEIDEP